MVVQSVVLKADWTAHGMAVSWADQMAVELVGEMVVYLAARMDE